MAEVAAGPVEAVPLDDSLGRVLREDVVATHDLPAADNSAMDGYAVRAEDIAGAPVTLPRDRRHPRGSSDAICVSSRERAMRIMTGAFVPEGADTVVQVELTDGGTRARDDRAGAPARREHPPPRRGHARGRRRAARRRRASVPRRSRCSRRPARSRVQVGRRPTVAILSTGDELIEVGETPSPGKIVNTNGPLLAALVREAGAIARPLGIVRDTREATIAAFEAAIESRLRDLVRRRLRRRVRFREGRARGPRRGDEVLARGDEAGQAGRALAPARSRRVRTAGESRSPASSPSTSSSLRRCGRRWGRKRGSIRPTVRARLTAAVRGAAERRVYARVQVTARDGELFATPLTSQSSGALTSMLSANGLAVVARRTACRGGRGRAGGAALQR